MAKAKLGGGKRFSALSAALSQQGARDPDALAAVIGRRRYGKARFAQLSAAGRKRKAS